ncbi:MAG: hypothetical protein PHP00_06430 [Thiotrichaceae bacterium]|nr:hypothetical protein [Thiotrichaceae bacterium]
MNKLSLMLICASLSFGSHSLLAAEIVPTAPVTAATTTATPPPPAVDEQAVRGAKFKKRCQEDPKWCEEKKAEIQKHREARKQWCAANPAECQRLKDEMKALKAQCKDSPEQCANARKEMKQKMGKQKHDAQQKWCDANPQRCETWKVELRKIEDQYREARRQLQEKFPDHPQF